MTPFMLADLTEYIEDWIADSEEAGALLGDNDVWREHVAEVMTLAAAAAFDALTAKGKQEEKE